MLFLLAPALALGAVQQCTHQTVDCSDPPVCYPLTDDMLNIPCAADDAPEPNSTVLAYNYKCSGTDIDIEYHTKADCSGSVNAECKWEFGENGAVQPSGCHIGEKRAPCTRGNGESRGLWGDHARSPE